MKLSLVICVVFAFLFSAVSGLFSSSCKNRSEVCGVSADCCPVTSRRMVCAPHLEICGKKKICCITEVEEQQEKQAALFRDRTGKLKRFLEILLNEDDE